MRTAVERVGPINADEGRVQTRNTDAKPGPSVALHSAERSVARLTAVREDSRAGAEQLEELTAQKNAVLGVDHDASAPFEREVGIGAQTALAVRKKLHVAIELPAGVDPHARHECLRKARLK